MKEDVFDGKMLLGFWEGMMVVFCCFLVFVGRKLNMGGSIFEKKG